MYPARIRVLVTQPVIGRNLISPVGRCNALIRCILISQHVYYPPKHLQRVEATEHRKGKKKQLVDAATSRRVNT